MRVLHITRGFPPALTGGLSLAVGRTVEALRKRGGQHGVVSLERRPLAPAAPHLWRVQALPEARQAIQQFEPQVIHVHDAWAWPHLSSLGLARPTVLTLHVWHPAQDAILGRPLTRSAQHQLQAVREAAVVVAPSLCVAADVARRTGVASRLIPLAAELPPASEAPPAEPPALLYAGRLAEVKGVPELLAAMEILAARHPEVTLRLAAGLPASPASAQKWQRRWQERAPANLRARVLWLGWLDPPALAHELRRATLVVVPSRYETFGLWALEAMAAGKCVLATGAGALPELIEHDASGWLVHSSEPSTLAEAIHRLLQDPARRARLGNAARQRASQFSWQAVAEAHHGLYTELL